MTSTNLLAHAEQSLLVPHGLDINDLDKIIIQLQGPSIDDADIYFQSTRVESWYLEDGIVKEGSYHQDSGAGLRAISGEKTGFAYSDEIQLDILKVAANNARAVARSQENGVVPMWKALKTKGVAYEPIAVLDSITRDEKIALIKRLDEEARALDPRITHVNVSLAAADETILVASSDGTIAADQRPLIRLGVTAIAEENGRREQGSSGGGGRLAFDYFQQNEIATGYAHEAVRQALINLEAQDAPAGVMPVVLGPGWPGILLHEAVGHGLEGDFNRKGSSAFSGKIGERVAAPGVTIIDDGTLKDRRGSLNVDDEGTMTQATTLIEDGILVGYMQDKLNARLMGMKPTGNGRRESYAHLPLPRMTNTFMQAGDKDPGEIIESIEHGLYAVNFGGGQVDITSGQFVFSATEAYVIKNGKVTYPVKGATLIGNGPEAMQRVSMIGNDFSLDSGVGVCGKEGQGVPVGVGQATIKIDQITVGGTQL